MALEIIKLSKSEQMWREVDADWVYFDKEAHEKRMKEFTESLKSNPLKGTILISSTADSENNFNEFKNIWK